MANSNHPASGDDLEDDLLAWATRARNSPSTGGETIDRLAEQTGMPPAELIRDGIEHVIAPDRREALRIYFEELFGEDRRALTSRRTDAAARIGYTEAAIRHRPGGDLRKSHEYALMQELSTTLLTMLDVETSPSGDLTKLKTTSNSVTSDGSVTASVAVVDADLTATSERQRSRRLLPIAVVLVLLAIGITTVQILRSDKDATVATSALRSPHLPITTDAKTTQLGGSAKCRDTLLEFQDLATGDAELRALARTIRDSVRESRKAGDDSIGCRTSDASWVELATDPRMATDPSLETRVAVERYLDRYGFEGAIFATQRSQPTFVPGPTYGAWEALNQSFPIGYPVSSTTTADGALTTKLSTDYPLTKGSLVAVKPNVPAFFLSDWIVQDIPADQRGYPLGNLDGALIPGTTTQNFEKGSFTFESVAPDGRPNFTFTPWPAATPRLSTGEQLQVTDPTGRTTWWIDTEGTRWWVPSGWTMNCLATGPTRTLTERVTAQELASHPVGGTVDCTEERTGADCVAAITGTHDVPEAVVTQFRSTYRSLKLQRLACPTSEVHGWGIRGYVLDVEGPSTGWFLLSMADTKSKPVVMGSEVLRWFAARTSGSLDMVGTPSAQPTKCGSSWLVPLRGGSLGTGFIALDSVTASRTYFDNQEPPCV
jgi:hypothetical protein